MKDLERPAWDNTQLEIGIMEAFEKECTMKKDEKDLQ